MLPSCSSTTTYARATSRCGSRTSPPRPVAAIFVTFRTQRDHRLSTDDTLTTTTLIDSPFYVATSDAAWLIRKPKTPHILTRSPDGLVLLQHTPASHTTNCLTAFSWDYVTMTRLSMMDKSPLESSSDVPWLSQTTHGSKQIHAVVLQFDSVQPTTASVCFDPCVV